jgi:hypothetical protein
MHHACHAVDVDASRRNVGRYESIDSALAELGEGTIALRLGTAPVHRSRFDTRRLETPGEAVGSVAGTAEHDSRRLARDQLCCQVNARVPVGLPPQVGDVACVNVARSRLVHPRVLEVATHDDVDGAVESRGEK